MGVALRGGGPGEYPGLLSKPLPPLPAVSWARAGAPPPVVVCAVGGRALLPCSWEEGGAHVEWRSRAPLETVYERWGEQTWAAPGFQGRLAMAPGALAAGDCSLELLDAQLLDGGEYDSYGLQGGGRLVRRVPLHSVRLSVHGEAPGQRSGRWRWRRDLNRTGPGLTGVAG